MENPNETRLTWPAAAAAGVVLLLVFSPPFVPLEGRAVIQAAFSFVCHQLPDRTLHLLGVPLAVCSRCVGIYAGLAFGTFAYRPRLSITRVAETYTGWTILAAVAVPGLDWLAGVAGMWDSGHAGRLATGLVFGVVAGFFHARGVIKLRRLGHEVPVADAKQS